MVGHTVYDKCKSKELITSLNHIGVSISYDEVRRCRSLLGAYAISQSEGGKVPIPSQFNTDDYLVVAFDNFDHQDKSSFSNPTDNHDTAIVLFQHISTTSQNMDKGKVSDMKGINILKRQYIDELDCQKILL